MCLIDVLPCRDLEQRHCFLFVCWLLVVVRRGVMGLVVVGYMLVKV